MRELGIEPPPRTNLSEDERGWIRWFRLLRPQIAKIQTFEATINPASVGANTTSEQTFTVAGLNTSDIVFVNKPSHTSGIGIVNCRASAANTIAITFMNTTSGAIDPPSESYLITSIRR